MGNSKLLRFITISMIILCLVGLLTGCAVLPEDGSQQINGTEEPKLPQPKTLTDPKDIELYSAIQKATAGREDVLGFIVFRITLDHVEYSEDGNLALAWISMVDKQTGEVQTSEPGLVIAHATGDPAAPWRVVFQADPNFAEELLALPESMMTQEAREHYMPAPQQESKDGVVYTGYKLPWTKGQTVRLTGSIGHVFTYKSCPSTCLYAFDFANGTMFDIKAAKHGYVKYVDWTHPNGNTTDANYIVLEDPSTSPTTYQVYYHLAQDSIPAALRVRGAEVMQGQFIGKVDDTGYSTGHHLHFHVHTTPNSVWGKSVDIVFDEVGVNGGRPRTCAEASSYPEYGSGCNQGNYYVSQNGDVANPTGAITNPIGGSIINSPTVNVSGYMQDDTAIASGQILYNYGDGWFEIGTPVTSTPFTQEINLCDSQIPDGPVFLAIRVKDKAGKISADNTGMVEVSKEYACEPLPPVCTPATTQVALHTENDFQGSCQLLEIGEYANLSVFSPSYLDNVKSIQVGSAISVVVYPDIDFGGTQDLFQDSDANLADNSIGSMNAASIKVVSRINPPEPPVISLPEHISAAVDLTLGWTPVAGEQTKSTLSGPGDYEQVLEWQEGGAWNVGVLAEGEYTWTVEARNLAGSASITQEFTVGKATEPALSHMNDIPDINTSTAVLLTWEVDQSADAIDHFELQVRNQGGEWADLGEKPAGDARQMTFWGVRGTAYEFRMRAVDQSGIAEEYLSVPETSTLVVDSCIDDSFEGNEAGDDDILGSTVMEEGTTQTHNWCAPYNPDNPAWGGDVDWVSFTAQQGDQLRLTTQPTNVGSAALLTLYEPDGTTFIGEARPADSDSEAALDWTAPQDGTYYLKLTSADGRIIGTDTNYMVGVEVKSKLQPGTLICGSAAVPALLAGAYAVSKQMKKEQKRRERKVMGR